jgi:hypothetical protein
MDLADGDGELRRPLARGTVPAHGHLAVTAVWKADGAAVAPRCRIGLQRRPLGVYRFWRDLGYAIGALLSGTVADFVGLGAAIHLVAALTFVSGVAVIRAMRKPRPVPVASVA